MGAAPRVASGNEDEGGEDEQNEADGKDGRTHVLLLQPSTTSRGGSDKEDPEVHAEMKIENILSSVATIEPGRGQAVKVQWLEHDKETIELDTTGEHGEP